MHVMGAHASIWLTCRMPNPTQACMCLGVMIWGREGCALAPRTLQQAPDGHAQQLPAPPQWLLEPEVPDLLEALPQAQLRAPIPRPCRRRRRAPCASPLPAGSCLSEQHRISSARHCRVCAAGLHCFASSP